MDSNGKYVDPKRLFPGKQVMSKRCTNTGHALELLKQDSLGKPEILVSHTGTNDLHSLRRDTAKAVSEVAERACRVFPETRVVISTLLPRRDTPPHVVHEINAEIIRSCFTLPNVHLARHTTIGTWDLYDGLHLNRDGVRVFAKTLKDVALNRHHDTTTTAGRPRPPTNIRNTPRRHRPHHPTPSHHTIAALCLGKSQIH